MPILICSHCGRNSFDSLNHGFRCQHCGTVISGDEVIQPYGGTGAASQSNFVIRAGKLEKYIGAATEVVIPGKVSIIGMRAFEKCTELTRVTISSSVTTIEAQAFQYCSNLSSVNIPEGATSIGHHAFAFCSKLKNITLPKTLSKMDFAIFSIAPNWNRSPSPALSPKFHLACSGPVVACPLLQFPAAFSSLAVMHFRNAKC